MIDYISWKQSTVQATSLPSYVRWVTKFHKHSEKEGNFTIEDTSNFKLHLEKSGYNPKNIQYGMSLIKDYINYLRAAHGLNFPIHLFRIKVERSKSHYPVTEEEYRKMISVLPKNEAMFLQRRLMIMMLHDTGVRASELLDLKISQISNREAIIENKKNKKQRLIAWSEETAVVLKFYLPLRKHLQSSEDWLFVSFRWRPCRRMTTRQLERIIKDTCKSAGVSLSIRPHSFRHGFVHRQLDVGSPVTTVAQMLGHSTTINVMTYAQLSSKEIRKAWGVD